MIGIIKGVFHIHRRGVNFHSRVLIVSMEGDSYEQIP